MTLFCSKQEPGYKSLQKARATTSHIKSVLLSIQPSNHILQAKAAKHSHQLPSVTPAAVVRQSDKPQSSSFISVHGSQPEQHKAASRGPQQTGLSVPNIQRKRNAQGRLRDENDLQAAPGTPPHGTSLQALKKVHSSQPQSDKGEHYTIPRHILQADKGIIAHC